MSLFLTTCEISNNRRDSDSLPFRDTHTYKDSLAVFMEESEQYPTFQKDSINIKGFSIGSRLDLYIESNGEPILEAFFSDPYWYDRKIVYSDYELYGMNNNVVGFKIHDQKMSTEIISRIGISDSTLRLLYEKSKLTPQGIKVLFIPVYQETQQLDEGLDFEFHEDGRVLIGYSSK